MNKSLFIVLAILGILPITSCLFKPLNINENKQKIYGLTINLNGSGGSQIVDINFDTGLESNPRSIMYQGSRIGTNVFGIAKKYLQANGQNDAILTVLEDNIGCGSGTALYTVDLNTGLSQKLGTALNYNYIKDIEINPVDNNLYGIYNNQLVRIDKSKFGSACYPSNPPVYATVEVLGTLNLVGVGPYSVSFDHLGTCYIISGKDHHRAAVQLPSVPNPSLNLNIVGIPADDASWSIPLVVNYINEASCISGITQIIGLSYSATPTIPNDFLHLGNPNWNKKGTPWQIIDYTSTAKVIGPK